MLQLVRWCGAFCLPHVATATGGKHWYAGVTKGVLTQDQLRMNPRLKQVRRKIGNEWHYPLDEVLSAYSHLRHVLLNDDGTSVEYTPPKRRAPKKTEEKRRRPKKR